MPTDTGARTDRAPIRLTGVSLSGMVAAGSRLIGPSAMAPLALAATAIGAIAIGRIAIADAVIRRLRAQEVEIGTLRVACLEVGGHRWPEPSASHRADVGTTG